MTRESTIRAFERKFLAINQMPRDFSFSIAADACYECFLSEDSERPSIGFPKKSEEGKRNRNSNSERRVNSKEI